MARCVECGSRLATFSGKTYHRDFLLVRDLAADVKRIARMQADPTLYELAVKGELYARALHDSAHGSTAGFATVGVGRWRGRAVNVVAKHAALLDGGFDEPQSDEE